MWRLRSKSRRGDAVVYPDFVSTRTAPVVVPFDLRAGLPADASSLLTQALDGVPWAELEHAYGAADDVPALLHAVALGSERVRTEAWWELWGNVHHQGTVYPATVRVVPFIAALAADPEYPDYAEALSFLRQLAIGDGAAAPQVRAAVRAELVGLLAGAPTRPELQQRALLLLVSAYPDVAAENAGWASLVPAEHELAWRELLAAGGRPSELDVDDDAAMDRQDALEQWALAGWRA